MDFKNPEEQQFSQDLLKAALLTETQLRTALEYQNSIGGKLSDIILKLGFVSEQEFNEFVAQRQHMHTIDLTGRTIDLELMRKIPREVIERHEVIPFRQSPNTILLAMSEPMDYQAIEEIQFLTSCMIETALAPRSQILESIAHFYAEHPELEKEEEHQGSLGRDLVRRIADPTVAALARALLASGFLDAEAWSREMEKD